MQSFHTSSSVPQKPALAVLFFLTLLISACSSGVQVRSDINPDLNFAQYKTYGFFEPLGIEGGYNSPIFGELFRAAIASEMESRGYRVSNNPDLIINVTSRIDDKVRMRSYTAPYMSGMYYGGAGGSSYGSGLGVGVSSGSRATHSEEVSVFIDLVDNVGDKIAWQGVSVITASDKKAQQLKKTIDGTTSKVFELYPHVAGQP